MVLIGGMETFGSMPVPNLALKLLNKPIINSVYFASESGHYLIHKIHTSFSVFIKTWYQTNNTLVIFTSHKNQRLLQLGLS